MCVCVCVLRFLQVLDESALRAINWKDDKAVEELLSRVADFIKDDMSHSFSEVDRLILKENGMAIINEKKYMCPHGFIVTSSLLH